MKFSITKNSFLNAVKTITGSTEQKGINPILANILIEAGNNNLRLIGTDSEIMQIIDIGCEVEQIGNRLISAKLLLEILSGLPQANFGDDLLISVDDNGKMKIKLGKNRINVITLGIEDFPPVPEIDIEFYDVKKQSLGLTLSQGSIAVAQEGSPIHKSVLLNYENDGQAVCSLDGKRLCERKLEKVDLPEHMKQRFIISKKAVDKISSMFINSDEAQIGLYKEQLVFKSGDTTLIANTIDGNFPDYNRIFPSEYSRKAIIDKRELTSALKSILPIAKLMNSDVVVVNVDISADEMKLWADTPQYGSSETIISCELEGEPINMSFNAKFIQNFLAIVEDEEIIIELTSPNYPAVLRTGNPESMLKYVVMPVVFVK